MASFGDQQLFSSGDVVGCTDTIDKVLAFDYFLKFEFFGVSRVGHAYLELHYYSNSNIIISEERQFHNISLLYIFCFDIYVFICILPFTTFILISSDMNPNQKMADKKFKAGKDNLTTGIFQWSKDYTSGASNFTEAVKLYLAAEKYDKALLALNELIVCNQKLLDNWAVARNYEEMLDIHIKHFPQTSVEKLHEMANKGLQFFRMADSIDKGLQMLIRVAKAWMQKGKKNEGIELLKTAYTTALDDPKSYKKKDIFNMMVEAFLENDILPEAQRIFQELIKMQNGQDCRQHGLIKILVILMQHEPNRAEKEMYELSNIIPAFLQSDECEVADQLIKAYKKGDSQRFLKWTTKPEITCIFPVIIIKKLRAVKVPSAELKKEPGSQNQALEKLLF